MPKNKVIYSNKDYVRDLEGLSQIESGEKPLDLNIFKRLMVHELCTNTNIVNNYRIGVYPIENVQKAIESPSSASSTVLVDTSRHLMNTSIIYKRMVMYYAKMGLFNYNIELYGLKKSDIETDDKKNKVRDAYMNLCNQFEKMGFKHEMSKIMDSVVVDDVFYGLIFEDTNDFFILKLDPSMCKICQVQDGVYNYKLNLAMINPIYITTYPEYVQQAYLDFHNREAYADGYYTPPADKQVCFKFNETVLYCMPFLLGLIKDLFDLDVYKQLKLQKARVDNFKAVVVEIPIDEDAVDKPLLTTPTLMAFAEMNKANMPDDVGLIHVPGKASSVSFKDAATNINNLSDAITNIYDNAGVSHEVFNSGSSGTAFKLSLENDASIVYRFYRQCERYFNRFIKLRKFNKAGCRFALKIHDSTVYNRNEVADSYLKASQMVRHSR